VIGDAEAPVVALGADQPLKPASNMKLLTTAAGLTLLTPDHQYETTLTAGGAIRDGVLEGDLTIRGTGDPNISGRFHDDDPLRLFRAWAKTLREAGIAEIRGDLVADDSYFDDVWFLPTWKRAQEGRWYSAQVSPLSLNDNCVDLHVKPTKAGAPAIVQAVPVCDVLSITSAVTTAAQGPTKIAITRKTGTNEITVKGTVSRSAAGWKDYVAVHDPALFFVHSFARVCRDAGIRLSGAVRRIERQPVAAQALRDGRSQGTVLVRHTSSLRQDLPVINTRSQNLHAELLLKAMGAAAAGEGSIAGGVRAIGAFLANAHIPAAGISIADGSGLSHENRLTARALAAALAFMRRSPHGVLYRDSLAVAAESGTLARRFRSHKALVGNVWAKTGYIAGASALSGYVRRGEKTWVFSILMNHLPRGLTAAEALQERIIAEIYKAME
jgi:D-alanyl-D-alanine carboxypeptidase/D-alanyl-D-alanine-endopeptidase (penicillin-binding protein 4)